MKSILIIIQFLTIVYALILSIKNEDIIGKQQIELDLLRKDSILIHNFFIEQSQKNDEFYIDYTNFNISKHEL